MWLFAQQLGLRLVVCHFYELSQMSLCHCHVKEIYINSQSIWFDVITLLD